jgi:hypothetical protein
VKHFLKRKTVNKMHNATSALWLLCVGWTNSGAFICP